MVVEWRVREGEVGGGIIDNTIFLHPDIFQQTSQQIAE